MITGEGATFVAGADIREMSSFGPKEALEFARLIHKALADIMRQGIQIGANAIINLKMTTGSYEQQGSKWIVLKVVYYGTAIRVR